MALLSTWRRRRERRALERRSIPDVLWASTLARLPFLARLDPEDLAELRRLSSLFLDRKEFAGAGGFVVDDDIAVAVAAQACLPVLRLGLDAYDGFVGIVMHADEVVAPRETTDDDGIVHAWNEVLSGEAMEGGPLMLAWSDVRDAGDSAAIGYNVVIHEFAHVIDMRAGIADGVPPLPTAAARALWEAALLGEYERFCVRIDDGDDETALDPYGAEAPEEFFAVAVEAFFVIPSAMRDEHPALYALFQEYFRQDPALREPAP